VHWIDTDEENGRLVRRTMLALCACGFLLSLTACNTRLSDNDHREECRNIKSCIGETDFFRQYSSIEGCVAEGQEIYNELEGECRKKYARLIHCANDNFQCTNEQTDYTACEEEIDALENDDCG
jgi:hypothetical protein